jgi:hypothetical protein
MHRDAFLLGSQEDTTLLRYAHFGDSYQPSRIIGKRRDIDLLIIKDTAAYIFRHPQLVNR